MKRELDEIRAMLHSLDDLRTDGGALAARLGELETAFRREDWLNQEEVEDLTAELRRFTASQRAFLSWTEHALGRASANMGELHTLLDQREDDLDARERLLQPCQTFLRLQSNEETLKITLAARQEVLRQAIDQQEDLELWSRGCSDLLEQLTARNYNRIGPLMEQYSTIFDFSLVAGVYSGVIFLPETLEEEEPLAGVPDAEAAPTEPAEEVPAPAEVNLSVPPAEGPPSPQEEPEAPSAELSTPVEASSEEAPAPVEEPFWPGTTFPEKDITLSFATQRRFEAPGGKKLQDFFQRPDFRELYFKLSRQILFSQAEHDRSPDCLDTTLRQAVREGYLTEIRTNDGRCYYQASPKLLSGMKKQSVHRCLQRRFLPTQLDALDEQALTWQFLEQVDAVYAVLSPLYDDKRLKRWYAQTHAQVSQQLWYQLHIVFECDDEPQLNCWLIALMDPGPARRAAFLEEVETLLRESDEEVWAVVPTQAEIAQWRDFCTQRNLTVPFWASLDQPGQLISPQGEVVPLPQFFLTLQEEPSADQAPAHEEVPADKSVVEAEEIPVDKPAAEVEELPTDEPVVEVEELPTDEPVAEVEEVPTDEPVVDVEELPADEPVVDVEELPADEPVVDVEELSADEPVVDMEELSADEPVVEVEELPADEPVAEVEEVPADEPVAEVEEVSTDEPVAEVEEIPVAAPVTNVEEGSIDEPVAAVEEVPADEAVEVVEEAPLNELDLEVSAPRQGLFTLDVDLDALWRQAAEWLAGESFQAGLCLLRVLRRLDRRMAPRYLQYAYALDDPAEQCHYLPDRLTRVYGENGSDSLEGNALSCLTLSANLRMAFTAEVRQNWYQAADALQTMAAAPLLEKLPAARSALELLVRTLRERRQGFEPQLIRQCQMWGDTNQKMEELSQTARDIRGGKYAETGFHANRLKGLFDALFGIHSDLMECLNIVAEKDTGKRSRVQELCAPLLDAEGRPHQAACLKRIDDTWDNQPSRFKQRESLMGKARNLAISRFRTCLEVCAQWLECSEAAGIDQKEAEQILLERDRLLEHFRTARRELEEFSAGVETVTYSAAVLLGFTLEELIRSLEGEPVDRSEFYVDFLRTGQVELDDSLLPVVESPAYILPGYEPWTRLAEHQRRMSAQEGTDWDSVVARIWSGERTAPDCYNFGTAQCIEQYAVRHNLHLSLLERADMAADICKVTGLVDDEELQFRARLELAATYGQIEDHACKERLSNAVTEALRPHYQESSNWGFYLRTMDACLAAVQREAERLEPRYRYEFDQLKQKNPPCPMFDKIEQLLQEKMFSVAHDYMQLVSKENITVPPESHVLQKAPENDQLYRFLHDQYTHLFRLCTEDGSHGRTLEHIYNRFAGDANQDKNSTKRSARQMICSWPKSNNTTPEMMQDLLRHLSFPVQQVTRSKEANTFHAEMAPAASHVFNHPHPIAAFGTQLSQTGLDVRILSGRKTAEELVDLINGLGRTDTPTLFLLDYALPLPERRVMASKLKRESAHLSTCLVLDRVLALFLTGFSDAERGKVFLQCALPFHFYNPYVKGDTPIPPEMFMGRKAQLEEILRNGGANIIYGGRQLGKTALLRRAADLVDDREKGDWAVYTDVLCRCNYQESLKNLYARLMAENFLKAEADPADWEELCERIRARMDDPQRPVNRFLLLMDEADEFLASTAACSYRPVECLQQLQTATQGRFKYVLAGLHNVMRFSREATRNNSVLGKLGSLTIKPLTYQEASQLLEEPLYYLGFRLDAGQTVLLSQILLSTNYYPGLIHFYCAQLVESLCSGMGNSDTCPPYVLDENQIRVLLQKKDFTSQIRDKFFITLDVEEDKRYYRILANALAYCYYEYPEKTVQGYTFQDILGACQDFSITSITNLDASSVQLLLSEMEELNILVCTNGHYTFNGANFRHMMGDYDTVFNELDHTDGEVQ